MIFRDPSADQLTKKLLEDAKRELVGVSKNREYYEAMEIMLQKRIKRLEYELGTGIAKIADAALDKARRP